jgi:hypothetical protein
MTIIVASVLGAMGFSAVLAIALGRAASLADRSSEQVLADRHANPTVRGYRQSYAGFSRAEPTITRGWSSVAPSSRTSVGGQRLPIDSRTARRQRVWLQTPSSGARP